MSNRTNKDKEYIKHLAENYINKLGRVPTTIEMQEYLESCGYKVSTGTVTTIYRNMGYVPERQPSFQWVKK